MIKKLKLDKSQTIRLGNEPFLVGLNETLTFQIESVYNLNEAYISLQNGEIKGSYKLTKDFIIPKEFLIAGQLNGYISQRINGNEVKRWFLSPLTIKEVDDKIEMFELLADLEKRVTALEENNKIIL